MAGNPAARAAIACASRAVRQGRAADCECPALPRHPTATRCLTGVVELGPRGRHRSRRARPCPWRPWLSVQLGAQRADIIPRDLCRVLGHSRRVIGVADAGWRSVRAHLPTRTRRASDRAHHLGECTRMRSGDPVRSGPGRTRAPLDRPRAISVAPEPAALHGRRSDLWSGHADSTDVAAHHRRSSSDNTASWSFRRAWAARSNYACAMWNRARA